MPHYRINLLGAAGQTALTKTIFCLDDEQALIWAFGMMGRYPAPGAHPAAEVWEDSRLVGKLPTTEKHASGS
jgi:hypothetical protein